LSDPSDPAAVGEPNERPMRRVVLRDFPIHRMDEARQHSEALVREFQMIVHADPETSRVPQRLLELAAESERRYAGLNPHAEEIVDDAIARGDEFVDLELLVPLTFRQETLDAVPLLLEVEEYCRSGQLLTLVPSDELRAFWVWYLGEFVRQIDGFEPVSWLERADAEA
jgi:hypothetical protein